MKSSNRLILGLTISLLIYLISTTFDKNFNPENNFFLPSFGTHTLMFLLSVIAIFLFKKHLDYKITFPKISSVFKPFIFAVLLTIFVNIIITLITKFLGYHKIETHPLLKGSSGWQILIFVFIYASIVEEILFRGFLLNFIQNYSHKSITIFKKKINYPVLISGLAFGLAHLILLTSEVSGLFVTRIVIFTTLLGILAGYYQEKYQNNAYAIIVHSGGNFIGVIATFIMNFLH